MLTGRTLKGKLSIAFALMLVLMAMIGLSGYRGIENILGKNHEFNEGIKLDTQLMESSQRIHINVLNLRRYEKDVVLNIDHPETVSEYKDKWEKERTSLQQDMEMLDKLTLGGAAEERDRLQAAAQYFVVYQGGFLHVLDLIENGMIKTSQEGNREISKFKEDIQNFEKAIEDNIARYAKFRETSEKLSISIGKNTERKMLGIVLIGLIVAIGLAFLITLSISRPLAQLVGIVEQVSQGDLKITINSRLLGSGDEIGRLARAFSEMSGGLNVMIRKIQSVSYQVATVSSQVGNNLKGVIEGASSQAASTGSASASVEQMNAAFREITSNVEHLFQTAETTSSSILEMTASISEVDNSAQKMASQAEE
ncbi:MAG TPA: methyl-accepting chemotaxis protein, partial [Nitrospiria bacterium]|nr:methyl-accepting chemotaxis protein [Nitrospiria bacterium]